MIIDTDISSITVEIEGNEYAVAEKTVETADKLIDAQKRCVGQPQYKMWLAELEVLLGKPAISALFSRGKKENIDRMQRIHAGVVNAFEYNASAVAEEHAKQQLEQVAPVNELIQQMNALMRNAAKEQSRR
jgi:hypothetical protein